MSRLTTTKVSSKGQVVIPEAIREEIGLHAGDHLLVIAEKGVVILKTIEKPDMQQFNELISKTRKLAKTAGLTEQDITKAIKSVRKK